MLARVEGSVRRRSWWQVHRCLTDPVARRNCEYKMASRQDFEFVLFRLPCTFCVLGEGFSTERKVSPLSLRGTTFTIKCDALFSLFLSQVLDFTIDDGDFMSPQPSPQNENWESQSSLRCLQATTCTYCFHDDILRKRLFSVQLYSTTVDYSS